MRQSELKRELMSLVDLSSEYEVEQVERYLNLVKIYKKLDKAINDHGAVIEVVNGTQSYLKANPAISEKVKVNQALLKLGAFFDKKKEQLELEEQNAPKFNPDSFLE